MRGMTHGLYVWGEFACFTRPEMKVERFSYPVITPSAGRGIFDAIYWKKSHRFYWQMERVEVLRPPRYIGIRRNEVKDKAPPERVVLAWMNGKRPAEPLWADGDRESLGTDQKGRTQRQTMALKDVRYRIYAHMEHRGDGREIKAMDEQFKRRASAGKCFYQPYFGCKEFPAYFSYIEPQAGPVSAVEWDGDLGWMLYDVFDLGKENSPDAAPMVSVFEAQVRRGVMEIPAYQDPRVKKTAEAMHA